MVRQMTTEKEGKWLLLEQVILSDQVPADAVAGILAEDREFAHWYKSRADQRAATMSLNADTWHLSLPTSEDTR